MPRDLATALAAPADLLIIGGGIVGAGLARDAALRGYRVLLVEQGDFASGTSSKTSKLIHGGIRYLEQGQLGLVRESCRERFIQRQVAARLVRPLAFLIPVYGATPRPPWMLHLGLWWYDRLAGVRTIGRHQWLPRGDVLQQEPALRAEGLSAGAVYTDCQMDDARLVLDNILDAERQGARCLNYVRVTGFVHDGVRATGVRVRDELTGEAGVCRVPMIINATGPWGDRLRQLDDPAATARLRPTKGTHIVVRRLTEHALLLTHPRDHRVVFVMPWSGVTLIGTTDTDETAPPEQVAATAAEVDYLLAAANQAMPSARLSRQDVMMTFAGVRPLLRAGGEPSGVSREHAIIHDASGLVSVLGGKYTTYRAIAEETLNQLIRRQRLPAPQRPCRTAEEPFVSRAAELQPYLTRDPLLNEPCCPHHPYLLGQFLYAWEREWAWTVSDLFWRRTPVGFTGCRGADCFARVAEVLVRFAQADRARLEQQHAAYQDERARALSCL